MCKLCISKSKWNVYLPGCSVDYSLCLHLATVHAVKKLTFYRRTTPTATGELCLRTQAYYNCGYRHTCGRTTLTFLLCTPRGTLVFCCWVSVLKPIVVTLYSYDLFRIQTGTRPIGRMALRGWCLPTSCGRLSQCPGQKWTCIKWSEFSSRWQGMEREGSSGGGRWLPISNTLRWAH